MRDLLYCPSVSMYLPSFDSGLRRCLSPPSGGILSVRQPHSRKDSLRKLLQSIVNIETHDLSGSDQLEQGGLLGSP